MKQISDDRIKHMHGVAEYMYKNALKYNLNPDDMYLLGLLHDIRYIHGKEKHEEHGAQMLSKYDYPYSWIIEHHDWTPSMIKTEYYMSDEYIPTELFLLWEADMSIESTGRDAGKDVGFEKRLENIGKRLGQDHEAYINCNEIIGYLKLYSDQRKKKTKMVNLKVIKIKKFNID